MELLRGAAPAPAEPDYLTVFAGPPTAATNGTPHEFDEIVGATPAPRAGAPRSASSGATRRCSGLRRRVLGAND